MGTFKRLLANLFRDWFALHRRFSAVVLDQLTAAIAAGERSHRGEIRFAVESRLAPLAVLEGLDASLRAQQIFAQLRVWDTERNSGVLFYVLMAERRIEIVADRGIAARVTAAQWAAIHARMRECYVHGQWREGSLAGIAAAHALLSEHFPGSDEADPGELPDRPVLL